MLDDTLEAYAEVALLGADDAARKGETNLGDLWTDALLWFAVSGKINDYFEEDDVTAGNDKIAVDADHVVALWNGGNLRADIADGKFGAEELAKVLPYPNKVAVVYMTGAQLREALEAASQAMPYSAATAAACASFMQVSGLKYTLDVSKRYDAGEAYGANWYMAKTLNRVTVTEVNGKAFDEAATYAVITNNANYNGMDSSYIFKAAAEANDKSAITDAGVRDVVWMYIDEELENVVRTELYGEPQGRITVTGTAVAAYRDVALNAWYAEAVHYVTANSLMGGDGSESVFNPNGSTTRGMLVTILYRLAGSPEVSAEGTEWYAAGRAWAMEQGISDGTRISDTLTREEAMTMLYRYAKLQGRDVSVGEDTNILSYEDAFELSAWAIPAIQWACGDGILGGSDGKLAGHSPMTRAEMAKVLMAYNAQ